MFRGKVNLPLVLIVTLGLSACASNESKPIDVNPSDGPLDISGTYEVEITYGNELARADRVWLFGNSPDIEFTLRQKGDKIKGEFSGNRNGTLTKGKIDDEEVIFEFLLEGKGSELKDGNGTWIVQEDRSLKGDFNIRDGRLGIVRGLWTLTKIE